MLTALLLLAALQDQVQEQTREQTQTPESTDRPPTDAEFLTLRRALGIYGEIASWHRPLFDERWNDTAETRIAIDGYANIGPHREPGDRSHVVLPFGPKGSRQPTALRIGAMDSKVSYDAGGFLVHEIRAWANAAPGLAVDVRRIRIVLPGASRTLSLAEVELIGTGIDRARLHATLSSKGSFGPVSHPAHISGFGSRGERALDGYRSSSGPWSCATTQREDDPWWEVDLGVSARIEGIRVHGDARDPRGLAGFVVLFIDEDGETVWRSPACPTAAPRLDRPVEVGPAWRRPLHLRPHSATSQAPDSPLADALDGDPDPRHGWSLADGVHAGSAVVLLPTEDLGATTLFLELGQGYGDWRLIGRLLVEGSMAPPPLLNLPNDFLRLNWDMNRAEPWSAATRRATALFASLMTEPNGPISLPDAELVAQVRAAVDASENAEDEAVLQVRPWLDAAGEVVSFDARLELASFLSEGAQ